MYIMSNNDDFYSNLVKKNLHPLFWKTNLTFNEDAADRLILIAEKFYSSLELDAPIKDIILIGSIANYNWHMLSDLDTHIVLDYNDISDDKDLVENYLELERKQWNNLHEIEISEYPVELSFNDVDDDVNSAGKYSLLNKEWIKIPEKENLSNSTIDESKEIFRIISKSIDEVEEKYNSKEIDPHQTYRRTKHIWKIIKKLRSDFLEEEGEYGAKNLAFKHLRNEEYLDKVNDLKTKTHDEILTLHTID